ncbi:MAG: hypothetical protein WCN95_03180 [bacterium]
MTRWSALCLAICATVLFVTGRPALAKNAAPVIQHTPVTVALQGQSIIIKATVTDDVKVKTVTLFYSTSKDVAPFRLEMQSAGQNMYICTVPDNLLEHATTLTYYIEAVDNADQSTETRWHNVSIQQAKAGSKPDIKAGQDDSSFWKTTALIGGGVVLAGGTAAIIAGNSGGTSQPPPISTTNVHAGTYIGSVTTQLEFPGESPATLAHGTTIVIDINGTVRSTDLYSTESLFSTLSGADFTLTANVSTTNLTGQINYYGTVNNGRITGSVGGQVLSTSGTNGTYYGNFYAVKQ